MGSPRITLTWEQFRGRPPPGPAGRPPQALLVGDGAMTTPLQGQPPDAADDVLDPAVLAELLQLRSPRHEDIFQALLAAFQAEAPKQVAAMRAAVAEGSAVKLRAAAHGLKGAAGTLGASRVADLCAEL